MIYEQLPNFFVCKLHWLLLQHSLRFLNLFFLYSEENLNFTAASVVSRQMQLES